MIRIPQCCAWNNYSVNVNCIFLARWYAIFPLNRITPIHAVVLSNMITACTSFIITFCSFRQCITDFYGPQQSTLTISNGIPALTEQNGIFTRLQRSHFFFLTNPTSCHILFHMFELFLNFYTAWKQFHCLAYFCHINWDTFLSWLQVHFCSTVVL